MGKDSGLPQNEKSSSPKLMRGVFLAVIAGLLINTFMGLFIDAEEFKAAFTGISVVTFLVPFLTIMIAYLIDTFRYKLVFSRFGIKASFRDSLYNNIIGYFFSNVTPGSVGGQPFQILHFSRLGLDSAITSNVVFSRLIETTFVQLIVVVMFFHKGIGMMASLGNGAYLLGAGMLVTLILTTLLLLGFLNPHILGVIALKIEKSWLGKLISKVTQDPRWAEKLSVWSEGLGAGFKVLWNKNFGIMLIDMIFAAVEQVLWSVALYVPLAKLVGTPPPFPEFLLSFVVCSLVSLFLPTPGASGSTEASFLLVLGSLTGKPGATMSAILIWRFGAYYLHLLFGGLIYFFVPTRRAVYTRGEDGILRHIRPTGRSAL
jgi:uncharacterized protein (TIRG00374 family)